MVVSAEDQVLVGIEHGRLGQALAGLSPELRGAIEATVLDGLTCAEAAVLLGVAEGTVKSRCHRARVALRAALAEQQAGPETTGTPPRSLGDVMTSSLPGAAGPAAGADGHAGEDLLAGYAAGTARAGRRLVGGGPPDRSARAAARPCRRRWTPERLARNRSVLLVRAAIGDGGRVRRLLRRCGVPDHLLRLLGGDPVAAQVLAAVRARRAGRGGRRSRGGQVRLDPLRPARATGRVPGPEVLAPFLLVAPLLVLAGVAAAFLPMFDPAFRLAVAAPFSGFTLLLVRSVSALAAALVPVVARRVPAARAVTGCRSRCCCRRWRCARSRSRPRPSLDPRAAAVTAGALWAVPVLCCWRPRTARCRSCRRTPSSRAPPCCAPVPRCCWRAVTASSGDG